MTESDFNNVSRTLLNAIRKFYEKEENIKAFELWQAERQKLQLNKKSGNMNNPVISNGLPFDESM